jgi:hypothetical protein
MTFVLYPSFPQKREYSSCRIVRIALDTSFCGGNELSGYPPSRIGSTVLREYGIRGVVGTTLFAADARTLGRVFAQRLAAEGGRYAAPSAASSRTARYSSTARPADPDGRPADPSTRVRSPASAWIKLASTAAFTADQCNAAARSRTAGAAGRCRGSGHAGSSRTSNDPAPRRQGPMHKTSDTPG